MLFQLTVEKLARLADDRLLPTTFERGWLANRARKEVNPVVWATHYRAWRRYVRQNAIEKCLAVASAGLGIGGYVLEFRGYQQASIVAYTLSAVLGVVFFGSLSLRPPLDQLAKEMQLSGTFDAFLADLQVVFNCASNDTGDYFATMSDSEIEARCTDWLVVTAKYQLEEQVRSSDVNLPDDVRAVASINAGEWMNTFKKRYDTFSRFQLAAGGYKSYFDKAKTAMAS